MVTLPTKVLCGLSGTVHQVRSEADEETGDLHLAALSALAAVKPQVDAFFDGVMVMADDAAVKQNRLNLLNVLSNLLNAVADIALLAE